MMNLIGIFGKLISKILKIIHCYKHVEEQANLQWMNGAAVGEAKET